MRAIDADALKKQTWAICKKKKDGGCYTCPFVEGNFCRLRRLINETPTIEPSGDLISREDAINEVHKYFIEKADKLETKRVGEYEVFSDQKAFRQITKDNKEICIRIKGLPFISAEPRKWETCFSCPLSKGCPKIQGKSNDELEQYASEIPTDCPIVESKHGAWVWDEDGMDWGIGAWRCSECGAKSEAWWACDKKYNPLRCANGHFCGNCGAKMGETK